MRKEEGESIKWVLNDLSDLSTFSEEFRAYCEGMNLDENKIFELELSLEELIVNSFTHGYKDNEDRDGDVRVEAEDTGPDLRVSLQDKAPPFDLFRDAPAPRLGGKDPEAEVAAEPEPDPEPEIEAKPTEEKQGGLGIHLVKSLNDKVEYYGSQDGNIVVIIKSKP